MSSNHLDEAERCLQYQLLGSASYADVLRHLIAEARSVREQLRSSPPPVAPASVPKPGYCACRFPAITRTPGDAICCASCGMGVRVYAPAVERVEGMAEDSPYLCVRCGRRCLENVPCPTCEGKAEPALSKTETTGEATDEELDRVYYGGLVSLGREERTTVAAGRAGKRALYELGVEHGKRAGGGAKGGG
jgi:hypothetical protein